MISISRLSQIYYNIPVTASPHNPTSDSVQVGFIRSGVTPTTTEQLSWVTGSWETLNSTTYAIQCLIGPNNPSGGITLPAGPYDVYVQITDNPEIPFFMVGQLTIT